MTYQWDNAPFAGEFDNNYPGNLNSHGNFRITHGGSVGHVTAHLRRAIFECEIYASTDTGQAGVPVDWYQYLSWTFQLNLVSPGPDPLHIVGFNPDPSIVAIGSLKTEVLKNESGSDTVSAARWAMEPVDVKVNRKNPDPSQLPVVTAVAKLTEWFALFDPLAGYNYTLGVKGYLRTLWQY